jgi:hypothetical protein
LSVLELAIFKEKEKWKKINIPTNISPAKNNLLQGITAKDSPAHMKQDSTDQTIQEDTCSTQNKPAHNTPADITMPRTDQHSEGQPEIPESEE